MLVGGAPRQQWDLHRALHEGQYATPSCMLFGLQEVALPSMSEGKRAWTLIQLLIRP
jgi:hypothetical protein